MAGGKHSSEEAYQYNAKSVKSIRESINFIKILIAITVLVVIVGTIFAIKTIIENNKKQPTQEVAVVVPGLPQDIEGYSVLGKIVIDKINVEQYILDSKEDKAMEKGVSKLYGQTLNDYGNFCIAGHNYENIFKKLTELEVGDTFKIIDKNLKETNYEIKEIYSVEPDDLKVLIQNDDKIEITLITCENGATTRLVVKSEKVEEKTTENNNVTNEVVNDSEEKE